MKRSVATLLLELLQYDSATLTSKVYKLLYRLLSKRTHRVSLLLSAFVTEDTVLVRRKPELCGGGFWDNGCSNDVPTSGSKSRACHGRVFQTSSLCSVGARAWMLPALSAPAVGKLSLIPPDQPFRIVNACKFLNFLGYISYRFPYCFT